MNPQQNNGQYQPQYNPPTTPPQYQYPVSPPQQPTPPGGKPTVTTEEKLKRKQIILIVVSVLAGIFFLAAAIMTPFMIMNQKKLDASYKKGEESGKVAQRNVDNEEYAKKLNSEFTTYKAREEDGSFEISYPKYWSVSTNSAGMEQLLGFAHPDKVDLTTGVYALRFTLRKARIEETKKIYDQYLKNKKQELKMEPVTIPGNISGYKYTGLLDQRAPNKGTAIIIPVRDKTLILQTDKNDGYLDMYNKIISQIKIYP